METKEIDTLNTWNESGGNPDSIFFVNISEKYKTFLWLWSKTGTMHMLDVLRDFGFNSYKFHNGTKNFFRSGIIDNHNCDLFPNHLEYKMMVSARNPYTRFFSWYKYQNRGLFNLSLEGYQTFLEKTIFEESLDCLNFHERKPDYFVRIENLYDDYLKIPFIIQSELFKSGELKKKCEKKINVAHHATDWRNYYNQSIADLIFYNSQEYFRIFNYDKNSWKK
jgi:hypothetical protein